MEYAYCIFIYIKQGYIYLANMLLHRYTSLSRWYALAFPRLMSSAKLSSGPSTSLPWRYRLVLVAVIIFILHWLKCTAQ